MSGESASGARFQRRFLARLTEFVTDDRTGFEAPRIEDDVDGRAADIYLPGSSNGSLVIEVTPDDVFPRRTDVVERARDHAVALDAEFFATCNSESFFLFDENGGDPPDAPSYSLRLTERAPKDAVPCILDAVSTLSSDGELQGHTERERVVTLLHSFHAAIWPAYERGAERAYRDDEQFVDTFDEWIHENDYAHLDRDEQFELAAKQYAYLLTNKVLFSELVRETTSDEIPALRGDAPESPAGVTPGDSLDSHVRETFERLVEEIDYRPIFEDDTALFRAFPETEKTKRDLHSLVDAIEAHDVGDVDEDLLGGIYEDLIPERERNALGQFYTPPKIAETIARWTIRDDDDNVGTGSTGTAARVLDPAAGSGTFTVEAYQLLDRRFPDATHRDVVDHIVAIDVNRLPLHLTALNLACRNVSERTTTIHAYHDSFFDVDPSTDRLRASRIDTGPGDRSDEALGLFDAVVGNPPYIRQEQLSPDREHFRAHLKTFGRRDATPYYDGSKRLSKRCDVYVYFVTHATQFLRDGGRLGYVIPTKWMMTRYGERFQEFLYDHYDVHAIVSFSDRAFGDALVDTCLLLAERCEADAERRRTPTKFVRIDAEMDPQAIVSAVDDAFDEFGDAFVVRTRPNYRTVAVRQAELQDRPSSKIAHYLNAPQDLVELSQHPAMVSLETLAEVTGGHMTGANEFFFLTRADLEPWPIHDRFLRPAVKSYRDVDGYSLTADDTGLFILDVDDYVEAVRRDAQGAASTASLERRVKDALTRDGYATLAEYIDYGEDQGYHTRRSLETRDVWFDVGELVAPEIVHPYGVDERVVVARNDDALVPSKRVQCIDVDATTDSDVLAGYLNSSVHAALLEFWGRNEGGGSLEIMTYELEEIPVLDTPALSDQERTDVRCAYSALVGGDDGAQDRLDAAVLSALGSPIEPETVREMRDAVTRNRVQGANDTNVLVRDLDEFDEIGTHRFQRGGYDRGGEGANPPRDDS
jgi:type I restriction-modification system DNA methylase subunit